MSDDQDTVTEVTHTNWFQRVARSVVGVVVGIVLVFACVGVLFWNEGRAVTTARSLAEGRAAVVPVASDAVDPANEGRLVHATGTAEVDGPVSDPATGISATGLRLVRQVEMYQWTETRHSETRQTLGGGEETVTTYTYSRKWENEAVDSSDFHSPASHENPPMPIKAESFEVGSARFGAFTLGPTTIGSVHDGEARPVKKDEEAGVTALLDGFGKPVTVVGGRIFAAANPDQPAIGDLRISYELVPPGPLSIVAMQAGRSFGGYQTRSGDVIQLVERGTVSAGDMFSHAETDNIVLTWIVRGVALLVLFIGFALIVAPLSVLVSVIPFLGEIVGAGTLLVSLPATLLVGGGTIAVAWLFYRPLVAVGVLALVALLVFGAVRLARRRRERHAAAPAPAAAGLSSPG